MNFNENQLKAIESKSKRIMCLAGAGAGKTRVVVERINQLNTIYEIPIDNILCLTFTRMAGKEMRDRIIANNPQAKDLFANTFHSFGCEVIDQFGGLIGYDENFTIYDREDEKDVLVSIITELNYKVKPDKYYAFLEGRLDEVKDYKLIEQCVDIKLEFYKRLREFNAIHLDGILEVTKKLLELDSVQKYYHDRYQYVFVDENQDNNRLQNEIVELINPVNLFVVGDENQSIYQWRGALPHLFTSFPERHGNTEIVKLDDNYRSTHQIVETANSLISRKDSKFEFKMNAHKEGPLPEIKRFETFEDEISKTMYDILDNYDILSDACVLTRTNKDAIRFAEECEKNSVPFHLVCGETDPLNHRDIRKLFTILRAGCNQRDDFTTEKLLSALNINVSKEFIAEWKLESSITGKSLFDVVNANADTETLQKIDIIKKIDCTNVSDIRKTFADLVDKLYLEPKWINQTLFTKVNRLKEVKSKINRWAIDRLKYGHRIDVNAFLRWIMLRDIREKLEAQSDGINIMTIHSAKGLEFKHVYIIGVNHGNIPSVRGNQEEELNLMYVAITRAEDNLTISYCNEKTFRYHKNAPPHTKPMYPSMYIDWICNLSLF